MSLVQEFLGKKLFCRGCGKLPEAGRNPLYPLGAMD